MDCVDVVDADARAADDAERQAAIVMSPINAGALYRWPRGT